MQVKLPVILVIMTVMIASINAIPNDEGQKFIKILNKTTYDRNNPFDLPTKKVLFYQYGAITDLYKTDNEVRNLVVPLFGYKEYHIMIPHAPIFFNMYKDGKCLGQYIMNNFTVHRINDGRDSTCEIPANMKANLEDFDKKVYIGTADGIYVYDMDTEALTKYGTVTEDIISIDKVNGKDEFYIVNADNKVYKVINNGSEVLPIEAITYAKKLVLDWSENAYFIDEDNKPQLLMKGESVPSKFAKFNFDIVRPVLGREVLNVMRSEEAIIPFLADGVIYVLAGNESTVLPSVGVVPDVTAINAEYVFNHYYAVDGLIYEHAILGHEIKDEDFNRDESAEQTTSESETEPPVTVFDRNVRAEYKTLRKIKNKH